MKRWPWVLVLLAMALSSASRLIVRSYKADASRPGLEAVNAGLDDPEKARVLASSIADSMDVAMYGMVAQLVFVLAFIVGLVAGVADLVRYWKKRQEPSQE